MKLLRRKVLSLLTCAAAWPLAPPVVRADSFLPRPVHIVVGFSPGGLGAPKATPAATFAVLNKVVNACLAEPAIANRIRELGGEPMVMSPRELDAFVAADTRRWAKAVKFSGAKVD